MVPVLVAVGHVVVVAVVAGSDFSQVSQSVGVKVAWLFPRLGVRFCAFTRPGLPPNQTTSRQLERRALRTMDVDRQNLQAENLLLGAMVQDLQARCARDDGPSQPPLAPAPAPPPAPVPPPPAAPLRMTEDALLDMHQECKVARQALRRQTDVLQRTQALLSDAKRTNAQQKQALTTEASGSGSNSNLPILDPR